MGSGAPLPQRKSIRLPDYDYRQRGAYFVTLCTENRAEVLSQIVGAGLCSARSGVSPSSYYWICRSITLCKSTSMLLCRIICIVSCVLLCRPLRFL